MTTLQAPQGPQLSDSRQAHSLERDSEQCNFQLDESFLASHVKHARYIESFLFAPAYPSHRFFLVCTGSVIVFMFVAALTCSGARLTKQSSAEAISSCRFQSQEWETKECWRGLTCLIGKVAERNQDPLAEPVEPGCPSETAG
jgi:hypothetical protein